MEYEQQKYTCPMHPEILQDGPGNCPKCGMTLVPAKQAAAGAALNTHHRDNSTSMDHTHHDHNKMPNAVRNPGQQNFQKYTCPMHPQMLIE